MSKESYNVLAEFQAILDSQSPQEAARMIAQVDPQVAAGLAPSGSDKQLLMSVPVAFFQGAEDRVVPPRQAEEMVEALRRRHIPFLYLLFEGEQHGFRRAENIKRALDAELYFYATFLTDQRLEFRAATS